MLMLAPAWRLQESRFPFELKLWYLTTLSLSLSLCCHIPPQHLKGAISPFSISTLDIGHLVVPLRSTSIEFLGRYLHCRAWQKGEHAMQWNVSQLLLRCISNATQAMQIIIDPCIFRIKQTIVSLWYFQRLKTKGCSGEISNPLTSERWWTS